MVSPSIIPVRHLIITILFVFLISAPADADTWHALQRLYERRAVSQELEKKRPEPDPWTCLREIYLPFTEGAEKEALADPKSARIVSGYLQKALLPYKDFIHEAAQRFDIPPEIIGSVIMVESGGNARARARTSTAKGLMQTIDGTFRDARDGLRSKGILINDDPFDPRVSIMAGAWYLDRMYSQAAIYHGKEVRNRQAIKSWRYPVEYYYAGPRNGQKDRELVVVYAGGRRVIIDKPAYSRKVLRWARIISKHS